MKSLTEEFALYELVQKKKYDFKTIKELYRAKKENKYIKRYINQLKKDNKSIYSSEEYQSKLKNNSEYAKYKSYISTLNKDLNELLENNSEIRELNQKRVSKYNVISLFESYLSRTLGHEINKLTEDIIIVRILHYSVLNQLINYGFIYKGEKYITLTASAGQIRNKKIVFIKESVWNTYKNTIMCGLLTEDINRHDGCNINKFLAYLALTASATDKWGGFDIDKSIVIDDFETSVVGDIDYVDNVIFEVTRKENYQVPITHSDGCGWMLPSESKKNFMVRLPWVKGLLTPVDYIRFCKEENEESYKIKDIYGKEYDLLQDDIRVIFTKSQFKMWKYYNSWDEYKEKFKKYNCHASMCNLEPNTKEFKNANFNYQMWQTLVDITDEEIEEFTNKVSEIITKAYKDKDTMLDLLGATDKNSRRSHMQEALYIYPELLKDYHIKEEISSIIGSIKKEAKFGKFPIEAKYTFLIPDVYAWMEFVFKKVENPQGLLKNGQVSCKLYKNYNELLVNRSPHLYREHCVRDNKVTKDMKKWFTTNGIYTSCHDLISKTLQFDNDGDRALVVAEPTLIKVAKRNMKGILPLYYEMGKAGAKEINSPRIYESLVTAFKYGNIGKYSNQLTVLWNSDLTNRDLTLHKIITALNNFSIDAAKTLKMPDIPSKIDKQMKVVNKTKMPYFFQFAKDKESDRVEDINNSTVNRICRKIENIEQDKFNFGKLRFRSAMLIKNKNIEIDKDIIAEYNRLNREKDKYFFKNKDMKKEEIAEVVWDKMRYEFDIFCENKGITFEDAVDMILKHIYKTNKYCKKTFLFNVFGEEIVNNLRRNINKPIDDKSHKICECCGKRIEVKGNRKKYCEECSKEIDRKKAKERMNNIRNCSK